MRNGVVVSRNIRRSVFLLIPLAMILGIAVISQGQGAHAGVVTPLSAAKLVFDGEPECLKVARETGDPDTGPSTFLLEAAPGCLTPAHYHTAVEQFFVVRGDVLTGMDGMSDQVLGPGGFAMMPSKAMHWFTCKSQSPCLMFVTFDRKYDIVWAKASK
jgi:quercetin dioxygenase-like cupin family protein